MKYTIGEKVLRIESGKIATIKDVIDGWTFDSYIVLIQFEDGSEEWVPCEDICPLNIGGYHNFLKNNTPQGIAIRVEDASSYDEISEFFNHKRGCNDKIKNIFKKAEKIKKNIVNNEIEHISHAEMRIEPCFRFKTKEGVENHYHLGDVVEIKFIDEVLGEIKIDECRIAEIKIDDDWDILVVDNSKRFYEDVVEIKIEMIEEINIVEDK